MNPGRMPGGMICGVIAGALGGAGRSDHADLGKSIVGFELAGWTTVCTLLQSICLRCGCMLMDIMLDCIMNADRTDEICCICMRIIMFIVCCILAKEDITASYGVLLAMPPGWMADVMPAADFTCVLFS